MRWYRGCFVTGVRTVAACLWSVGGYDSLTPVQYLCTVILDDDKKRLRLRDGQATSKAPPLPSRTPHALPALDLDLDSLSHFIARRHIYLCPYLYSTLAVVSYSEPSSAARCFCFCCCDLGWQSLSCYGMGQVVVCEQGVEWASDTVPADGQ